MIYKHDNRYIDFWQHEGEYLNGLQYKNEYSSMWDWSNPKEYYNKFCRNKLEFTIYSFRKYGQPKLDKPKELKGIKQSYSIDYIPKKCRCQIFVLDNDVWIKHGDYFSKTMQTEEIGAPLDVLVNKYTNKTKNKKFIYGDAWGSLVLRDEAYIKINNLISEIKSNRFELDIINDIVRQQEKYHGFKEFELCCTDIERFWEKVVKEVKTNV